MASLWQLGFAPISGQESWIWEVRLDILATAEKQACLIPMAHSCLLGSLVEKRQNHHLASAKVLLMYWNAYKCGIIDLIFRSWLGPHLPKSLAMTVLQFFASARSILHQCYKPGMVNVLFYFVGTISGDGIDLESSKQFGSTWLKECLLPYVIFWGSLRYITFWAYWISTHKDYLTHLKCELLGTFPWRFAKMVVQVLLMLYIHVINQEKQKHVSLMLLLVLIIYIKSKPSGTIHAFFLLKHPKLKCQSPCLTIFI